MFNTRRQYTPGLQSQSLKMPPSQGVNPSVPGTGSGASASNGPPGTIRLILGAQTGKARLGATGMPSLVSWRLDGAQAGLRGPLPLGLGTRLFRLRAPANDARAT